MSTIEAPAFLQAGPGGLEQAVGGPGGGHDGLLGSVDDHHIDDLPAQLQNDAPPDTAGLLQPALKPCPHGGHLARSWAPDRLALAAPFVAGPLRPPRGAASAG